MRMLGLSDAAPETSTMADGRYRRTAMQRLAPREADEPRNSLVARFGADKPLKLDAGVELSPFQIAYQTYGTLNADAHQRGADLPRADRRPARRQRASGHRQARLVGDHGRSGQADRHRALFRHLPERARRLHGLDRAGLDQSGDRQAVGPRFSGHHHPRHGARAGDAARSARHRHAVRGRRRLDGRHAGAAMGGELSRARVRGAADRLRDAAFGAEHRLPRGRPPGGDGRSGMARRPLSSPKARDPRRGLAVARMGAHITYLSDAALHRKFGRKFQDRENPTFSFDADFEVESYLRHQGISFVERFDANSYLYLTRAMDYFDLAADYDGVLANAFRGAQTRFCVISFTSDWLFPTSESRAIVHALNAAGARVSFAEIVTDKGHDAFLLDEPELFAHRARLPRRRRQGARPAGAEHDDAVAPQARSHHGRCRARRRAARASTCVLVADMVEPGARVLDVGCGDGELLRMLGETAAASTAAASRLSREGVNECVAKGLAVIQGDADTDLADYPDDAFDYVILSQTLQATRQPARRARAHAAHRPARHRVVPEFRPLADPAAAAVRRPHAADRQPAVCVVRHAQHPLLHHQGLPSSSATTIGAKMERAVALNAWGTPLRLQRAVVVLEPVRRAGGVSAQPQRLIAYLLQFRRQVTLLHCNLTLLQLHNDLASKHSCCERLYSFTDLKYIIKLGSLLFLRHTY